MAHALFGIDPLRVKGQQERFGLRPERKAVDDIAFVPTPSGPVQAATFELPG